MHDFPGRAHGTAGRTLAARIRAELQTMKETVGRSGWPQLVPSAAAEARWLVAPAGMHPAPGARPSMTEAALEAAAEAVA